MLGQYANRTEQVGARSASWRYMPAHRDVESHHDGQEDCLLCGRGSSFAGQTTNCTQCGEGRVYKFVRLARRGDYGSCDCSAGASGTQASARIVQVVGIKTKWVNVSASSVELARGSLMIRVANVQNVLQVATVSQGLVCTVQVGGTRTKWARFRANLR